NAASPKSNPSFHANRTATRHLPSRSTASASTNSSAQCSSNIEVDTPEASFEVVTSKRIFYFFFPEEQRPHRNKKTRKNFPAETRKSRPMRRPLPLKARGGSLFGSGGNC